jgi:hypothetical protein
VHTSYLWLVYSFQGPVRFYDNERKASILLKQFQSKNHCNTCAWITLRISNDTVFFLH